MAKLVKWLFWLVGILILAPIVMIAFSPYGKHEGFTYKLVKTTVTIDQPVSDVYTYLGKSANAADWSVFVDHITPLNPETVPDGAVGSKRRVFCFENEHGQRWDELITENMVNKKRQLELYNFVDFAMTADHLATEQRYESLAAGKTRLSFTLFFKNHEPGWIDQLKMYLAAYRIAHIFEQNMENIKKYVEEGAL